MVVRRIRNNAYGIARVLGDVQAASRGPVPLAKRLVRKSVYRRTGRATRGLLRALGLSR